MWSLSFVGREDSTLCLVDSWDSTMQPWIVFGIFRDAISCFASTFVVPVWTFLLQHYRVLASRFSILVFLKLLFWLEATRSQVWQLLDFLSVSAQSTHIPLEVSLSIMWSWWILSKIPINFSSRPFSNNHLYDFLATRPDLCELTLLHQCISMHVKFVVMTINEFTLSGPKVFPVFSVVSWFCRLRLSRVAIKFSTEIFTHYRLFLS